MSNNNKHAQSQEDKDSSDFDSVVSDTQAYELLKDDLHALDDILLQQQSNQFHWSIMLLLKQQI